MLLSIDRSIDRILLSSSVETKGAQNVQIYISYLPNLWQLRPQGDRVAVGVVWVRVVSLA